MIQWRALRIYLSCNFYNSLFIASTSLFPKKNERLNKEQELGNRLTFSMKNICLKLELGETYYQSAEPLLTIMPEHKHETWALSNDEHSKHLCISTYVFA